MTRNTASEEKALIVETTVSRRIRCRSMRIVRNRRHTSGNPRDLRRDVGASRALKPKVCSNKEPETLVWKADAKGSRLKGVPRILGVSGPARIAYAKNSPKSACADGDAGRSASGRGTGAG